MVNILKALGNLKIGTQLKLGFGIVIFLVFVISSITLSLGTQIQEQMDNLYNHPLQVRRAIGDLRKEIHAIQSENTAALVFYDPTELERHLQRAQVSNEVIQSNINILSLALR